MSALNHFLGEAVGIVWGLPLVIALCGMGFLLTIVLRGIQWHGFRHALDVVRGRFDNPKDPGQISHFAALCTALSATVGLGNIAGVAVAIHMGGPGATFWMIVVGLLGMATKFAEVSLGMMYRKVDKKGVVHGGPMYYIEKIGTGLGKKWKWVAVFYAFAAIAASFGAANMFQTNQVASILFENFTIPKWFTGGSLAILVGVVIIGGIQRIGHVTSKLVPLMGAIYVLGALLVILLNITAVPAVIYQILHDAFTGTAAIGGFSGIAVRQVLVQGVRRACFSNEAGLGSATFAHSAAATSEPIREGVVALLEPFIDTVVICSMTALVILISGAWGQDAEGVVLTSIAFDSAIPGFGRLFVPLAVFLFAYSTLLSWSYYGERAVDYLWKGKGLTLYKIIFCFAAFIGAVWKSDAVLNFSDLMLGLMVAPNLLAMLFLMPKLSRETKKYFNKLNAGEFKKHRAKKLFAD